jgi:hypothetical protein
MIDDVEDIRPELSAHLVSRVEPLGDGQIGVVNAFIAEIGEKARTIAERARGGLLKCAGIEPVLCRSYLCGPNASRITCKIAGGVWVANYVHMLSATIDASGI